MLFMSIPSPDTNSFNIGSVPIAYYALCLIAGMVVARIWTGSRLTKRGGEPGVALDFTLWAVALGIVGARLYHVLTHAGDYFGPGKNPIEIIRIDHGGIAIFGALLGGALGILIASRLTGVRFFSFADALVPGLLLAQAVGRLGNWFNHELFGGPTTLPWGLEIETTNPAFPVGMPEGTLFHPTFLYEIIWNILGIVVLLAIEKRLAPRWGQFIALYFIWYGIGRAWIESVRVDPSYQFFGFRTNVLMAFAIVLLGVVLYFVQRRRHPGLEASVYLPGRMRNDELALVATNDPEEYYHVLEHTSPKLNPQPAN
ncbi:prolipoprotein diacylglyceryl transferase [Leucobacter sp. UCMA 4100]|uniref:prolipoprotein diacylglyceryl transferase n=1 Tax=Leucobacter sp. UCMA 4100 TaxID=2810534 RepID=UPI0022EA8BC0|nr:prolipoprotein diacylglyceryl transferase [Leucobacter sp. UCMA 4100]